jgi:putative peptidoglycan lipid II flippase
VRTILRLSGWTLGFVAANQLAVFVVLALEFHTGPGGVSAYTYAYTFFQLPFGVVAVSVVNVATPELARAHSLGRPGELGARFGTAARQVLALVLPAAVGYLVLARQIISLVIDHGAEVAHGGAPARTTAATLAMFALGLPAFCVYLLAVRAFQAMQDTRTAFVLYVLENATNILVALILYRTSLGVRGLALSYSIAYSVAALAALAVLHERLGTIGGVPLLRAAARSIALSLVMALAVALVAASTGGGRGVAGWIHLLLAVATGVLVYLGGAGCAASLRAWQTSRRRGGKPPPARQPGPAPHAAGGPLGAAAQFREATRRRAASQTRAAAQSGSTKRPGQAARGGAGRFGAGSANRGSASGSIDRGGRHRQRRRPSR